MQKPVAATAHADHLRWPQNLLLRLRVLWPLKAFGTMAFMGLFFWAYFAILRHPLGTSFEMPRIFLDEAIAFSPIGLPVYASLWVYVSLPPALLGNFRTLIGFGLWISALCLFCLGIFWLWPTTVPAAAIDWQLYPEFGAIKNMDAGGNACPSLHVASSVFSALWLQRILTSARAPRWLRLGNASMCLAILWSTVAIRQHVVLDVLAGTLVGLAFAFPALKHVERLAGKPI